MHTMQITRSSVDTMKGPADWFSGDVDIDAIADPAGSSVFAPTFVHFRPGARGDRVFFEPGENHWHGAAPKRFMVHIAMQQNHKSGRAGGMVSWGEHVSDEQYAGGRSA